MALDKLTLLDETVINNSATSAATIVVNNSVQTNYISFAVATASPTSNGWRTYNDEAATSPVDGVSGTVNSTLTQNTVLPLNSTGDFRLTKNSGTSRQGEGFSTDFTIANRHLGKVLQISFDYELVSGALTTDDIRLYVIQSPSSSPTVIEPVGVSLQGTVSGTRLRHLATFQTHISITSYRLCIHIATTTNSNQTIDFNNFRVWEPTQSIGAVITDWQNFTPTINGITTSSSSFQWRRIGGSVEIFGAFTFSSATNVTFQIPLPSGLNINSSVSRKNIFGKLHLGRASADGSNPQWFIMGLGGNSFVTLGLQSSSTSSTLNDYPSNGTGAASGDIFTLEATIPIAGWGSSVAMSSDTGDGRVISAMVTGSLSTGANTSTNLTWSSPTILYDTHGGFNATTGYTAPVSGYYQFTGYFNTDSTNGTYWNAWVSGSNRQSCGVSLSGFIFVSGTVLLLAGQNLTFRPASGSVASVSSGNYFTINRVSTGRQVIATQETVACRYVSTSGQTIGTDTVLTFATRVTDTHGAYNTTTGIFTAPMSGWYNVGANLVLSTNTLTFIEIQQNSTTRLTYQSFPSNRGIATTSVYLLSGETLRIRASANTSTSLNTTSGDNSINFYRVGV